MTDPPGDDEVVLELTGLTPEAFTARRNDLVRALKAAKQKERAAAVAALRKPAGHLWAANHLARQRPLAVTRLTSAAADLADAQEKALGGEPAAGERLRRDSGAYQRALDLAVREGVSLLRSAGRSATEDTIRRLRDVLAGAATGPEDVRRRLGAGTLVDEPPPPGASAFSFGGEIATPAPRPKAEKPGPGPSPPPSPRAAGSRAAHERLTAARKSAETSAQASRRLAEVARRARRRADAAAAEAASADAEATEAEARAEAAAREAEKAAQELAELRG